MKINGQEKESLIRFNAITVNQYIRSFFGKAKHKYCKKMISKNFFMETVMCLSDSWHVSEVLVFDI